MAIQRIFLRAHEGYSVCVRAFNNSVNARLKNRRLCEQLITDLVINVATLIVASCTKFLAKKYISNSIRL